MIAQNAFRLRADLAEQYSDLIRKAMLKDAQRIRKPESESTTKSHSQEPGKSNKQKKVSADENALKLYEMLEENHWAGVAEISYIASMKETTAYTYLCRLLKMGLVQKQQLKYRQVWAKLTVKIPPTKLTGGKGELD